MLLSSLIPDVDLVCALEPDELGLRMLPVLADWPNLGQITVDLLVDQAVHRDGSPFRPHHYPHERRTEIEVAIREAWAWLEGAALLIPDSNPAFRPPNLARRLSRRARLLAKEQNPKRALAVRRIAKDSLHETIREEVWSLYHRGEYDTAVFVAMKAVEVSVRDASGLSGELGVRLMRKAFDLKSGPLTDMGVEEGERDARSALFAGAIGSYKNPHSHRNVALDDPDEAAEIIMLANHLLRIVDSRKAARP